MSDGLCRLATGGGWSTRELYTDTEEVLIDAQRPVLLNGIDDVATRDDLRRDEDELRREYEAMRPRVLGALLDAVSKALRRWEETRLPRRPRMADYARWVAVAEPALPWEAGKHLEVYTGNRQEAAAVSLESNAVAQAVLALMERRETWEGTATELLAALEQYASDRDLCSKRWPGSPPGAAGALAAGGAPAAAGRNRGGVDADWEGGDHDRQT